MINFSSVKEIIIPEGKVSEIKRNGIILWRNILKYVSFGDSIAAGHAINENWKKSPFDATLGQYAEVKHQYQQVLPGSSTPNPSTILVTNSYTELINRQSRIETLSFARSGDMVSDLIKRLSDEPIKKAVSEADLVTLCIGANDVLTPALLNIERYIQAGDSVLGEMEVLINNNMNILKDDSNSNSYFALFSKLKNLNPNAEYIFTTIYNPYKYLHLDEGTNGFFSPLLNMIPTIKIDVDKFIEDTVLGGQDFSYPSGVDFSWSGGISIKWTSFEIEWDVSELIRSSLLNTSVFQVFFRRTNGLSQWTETRVNNLNNILREKVDAQGSNFKIAETKALFDTYPDRSSGSSVCYNDLVNVEFTRGFKLTDADWGKLYGGKSPQSFWGDLAWKHTYAIWKGWDDFGLEELAQLVGNISFNPTDYVSFDMEGFAAELLKLIVEEVLVPDLDPHPEEGGHRVLCQSFQEASSKF